MQGDCFAAPGVGLIIASQTLAESIELAGTDTINSENSVEIDDLSVKIRVRKHG